MSRKTPEKTKVQDKVMKLLKFRDDVIDLERTPSFRYGRVTLGTPGCSDIKVVFDCGDGTIALLYLECKAPGVSVEVCDLPYEQRRFAESKEGKPKTLYRVINDPRMLKGIIREVKAF